MAHLEDLMECRNGGLMTRRGFVAAAVAAGLTLATSGCSGSGSTDSAQTAQTDSYSLVTPGKLTVAWQDGYPPMEALNTSTNVPEGYDVDMITKLAEKLGLTVEYLSTMHFDAIIPTIKQGGKADVGVSSFTITDARRQEIDFTDPYIDSNQSIVTRADATADTADALNAADKKIAVESGTTGEAWADENLSAATIVKLDDIVQCMTGTQTGLYDAVVCDLPVLAWECKNSYTDLKVAVEIPTGEQYGIVVSKDNPGLTQALNEGLAEMTSAGDLEALEVKWFGEKIS